MKGPKSRGESLWLIACSVLGVAFLVGLQVLFALFETESAALGNLALFLAFGFPTILIGLFFYGIHKY